MASPCPDPPKIIPLLSVSEATADAAEDKVQSMVEEKKSDADNYSNIVIESEEKIYGAYVDEDDNELPVGEPGELVIRPIEPAIMASKYIGMPEETAKAWRNSWFHTGDLAKLDEEGDLFWLARMSERIRVKGEMVSAYEIEEGIFTHPVVTDCAVIGIPDGIGEEQVKAFVTLKENKTLSLEELRLFCAPIMGRFMVPTALEVITKMPRTQTGKPAKEELKKRQ